MKKFGTNGANVERIRRRAQVAVHLEVLGSGSNSDDVDVRTLLEVEKSFHGVSESYHDGAAAAEDVRVIADFVDDEVDVAVKRFEADGRTAGLFQEIDNLRCINVISLTVSKTL